MSESISLVVLRLEIETGYFLTTDLNYNGIIITMFIHFYDCFLFKILPYKQFYCRIFHFADKPIGLFRSFLNTVLINEKFIITLSMVIYLKRLFLRTNMKDRL